MQQGKAKYSSQKFVANLLSFLRPDSREAEIKLQKSRKEENWLRHIISRGILPVVPGGILSQFGF